MPPPQGGRPRTPGPPDRQTPSPLRDGTGETALRLAVGAAGTTGSRAGRTGPARPCPRGGGVGTGLPRPSRPVTGVVRLLVAPLQPTPETTTRPVPFPSPGPLARAGADRRVGPPYEPGLALARRLEMARRPGVAATFAGGRVPDDPPAGLAFGGEAPRHSNVLLPSDTTGRPETRTWPCRLETMAPRPGRIAQVRDGRPRPARRLASLVAGPPFPFRVDTNAMGLARHSDSRADETRPDGRAGDACLGRATDAVIPGLEVVGDGRPPVRPGDRLAGQPQRVAAPDGADPVQDVTGVPDLHTADEQTTEVPCRPAPSRRGGDEAVGPVARVPPFGAETPWETGWLHAQGEAGDTIGQPAHAPPAAPGNTATRPMGLS